MCALDFRHRKCNTNKLTLLHTPFPDTSLSTMAFPFRVTIRVFYMCVLSLVLSDVRLCVCNVYVLDSIDDRDMRFSQVSNDTNVIN